MRIIFIEAKYILLFLVIFAVIISILLVVSTDLKWYANEREAINSLKQIVNAEAQWYQLDPDQNGINDYWTYDVSCLHRIYKEDGETKYALIPLDIARSDAAPAFFYVGEPSPFGGKPLIECWFTVVIGGNLVIQPVSGYWLSVMHYTSLDRNTVYRINEVGTEKIPACNSTQYGFMAVPDVYAKTGFRSFIVNEDGVIWETRNPTDQVWHGYDYGDNPGTSAPGKEPDGNKWTTDAASGKSLCWPVDTNNPTPASFKGLGVEPWEPVN